jgi:hypothetical protein
MTISSLSERWLIDAIEKRARLIVQDNLDKPTDHEDLAIIRFYMQSSIRAKAAFCNQLINAFRDSPRFHILTRKR